MPSYGGEGGEKRMAMGEGPTQSISKKKGEIETLISLMDAKIAAVEENTKMLLDKIAPILSSLHPTAAGEDRAKPGSTLGQVLSEYTYRLDGVIDALGHAIERVEL